MKTSPNRRKAKRGLARVLQAALIAAVACSTVVTLLASPPSWWSNGVLDPQATADDYAAVNQGQLKNIAKQASLELDTRLPGGAGTNVLSLVQGWSTPGTNTDDFAPVNLGQLKNVAKPFYDRLQHFGISTNYPWVGSTNAANDFALANIGQVKNLFGFELGAPEGELPEWWVSYFFPSLAGIEPYGDEDGDGFQNIHEFLEQSDPTNPYSRPGETVDRIALTSPPSGTQIIQGSSVALVAEANDLQGVDKVEFYKGSEYIGEVPRHLLTVAFALQWDNPPAGVHSITARATDSLGAVMVSAPITLIVLSDTDFDGMPDGWEVANGLNPLADDTLEDHDGDRIPNVFEFKRGTLANDAASKPAATFVVNPATGDNSASDYIYATIQEAVNKARELSYNGETGQYERPNAYAVIEVKAVPYAEKVTLSTVPVVLLGELGAQAGPPAILGRPDADGNSLEIYSASVVDGFEIGKVPGRKGRGVYARSNARLVNCLIRGNEDSYGAAAYNDGARLDMVHCTVFGNKGTYSGRGIYNTGILNLVNSIVWGNTGAAAEEIYNATWGTPQISASTSILAGGEHGGLNLDPLLTPAGWLKSTSPAINRAGAAVVSRVDIHGEARPAGATPDLGADEYKDANGTGDGDGLPDWAEGAEDQDGLSALEEYTTHGTNPFIADIDSDGLNDGAEVELGTSPTNPDTDFDGMPEMWEVVNGLNPLADDTLEDHDGDRIPNVFEFKRGFLADDAASKPAATFVVNPATGDNSASDHIYATIQEAVSEAQEEIYNWETGQYERPNAYAVIDVKAVPYAEKVTLGNVPVVLLGELGAQTGPPAILGRPDADGNSLEIYSASVVDGFEIGKVPGRKGCGVYVQSNARLVNCLIRGNEDSYGAAAYNDGPRLDMVHCTVFGNKGTYAGRGIYNTGILNLVNSIVWGNTGAAAEEIYNATWGTPQISASTSILAGGEHGGLNLDPLLTPAGWLKSTSPAINRAGAAVVSRVDIHGEARPAGATPDLGADEYKDANGTGDGDGLPDWAEGAEDQDGLSALEEYTTHGTNPFIRDTDKDGLSDGEEIGLGTDPLNPDTDDDRISDGLEVEYGLDPHTADDLSFDTDGDGLPLGVEIDLGLDPTEPDSDGDGSPDGAEIAYGTDPSDRASSPPAGTPPLPPLPGPEDPQPPTVPSGPPPAPSPPSPPADPTPPGIANIEVWVRSANKELPKYGWATFTETDPPRRYLRKREFSALSGGSPESRVGGDGEWEIDPETGAIDGQSDPRHFTGNLRSTSPTYSYDTWTSSSYDDPPNRQEDTPGTMTYSVTLSTENKTAAVRALGKSLVPDYTGNFVQENAFAYRDLWEDELGYSYQRMEFKLKWSGNAPEEDKRAVSYLIVFQPEDDPETPEDESQENAEVVGDSIEWDGIGAESETFSFDPDTLKSGLEDGVFYLLPFDIIPNFNRDETIDLTGSKDRGKVTEQKPLRWWINDDSDNGDIASGDSDVPGALTGWFEWDGRTPNHDDTKVNGRCDLPDFFPLFFDLKQMIEVLPPSGSIQYKFKHEEDALGFVYTDLTPDQADDFCIEDATTGYGPNFTQPAKDATVTKITSAGVVLSTAFLNKIKDDGKGVLLFEASKATTKPLILEVTKDGQKLTEVKFFLKADSVEKMYRWVNLRGEIGASEERPTNLGQPENYPDDLTNSKNFIQVHGYNVSEKGARGWNAEVFKRLHQLGSKAKFVAVTWRGDDSSQFAFGWRTPDYHENVTHAFETSEHLAAAVNGLSGEKYILGHSLGNMLASSAIKDRSMSVSKYFAVDAAVAMEAYDASLEGNAGMRDLMRNFDWQNYNTRLWSSEWHKLFGSGDGRNKLTWRGRFGAFSNAINFHSTGEEVLRNPPDGGVPTPSTDGDLAWVLQEKAKGTLLAFLSTLDSHGGWGFNANWDNIIGYDPQTGAPITVRRTPAEADTLTDAQLQSDSFFKRFDDNRLYNASQGSAAANENRARMLAEGVPALSFPAGSNPLTPFGTARNVDLMNLKTGTWPRGNGQWRHSDFREVAFYFTQRLYKRFIDEGELKQ